MLNTFGPWAGSGPWGISGVKTRPVSGLQSQQQCKPDVMVPWARSGCGLYVDAPSLKAFQGNVYVKDAGQNKVVLSCMHIYILKGGHIL